MKTAYSLKEVTDFLGKVQIAVDVATVTTMAEGHSSQVFRFQTKDSKAYVLRIRTSKKDLLADQYAYNHFAATLPISPFIQIGQFDEGSYFCITEYIQGHMLNTLNETDFKHSLPAVQEVLAKTFQMDISSTSGYGDVDFNTGNAKSRTWKASLEYELRILATHNLERSAKNNNLPDDMVERFLEQFNNNLPYVSETRRLLHGDPGGDNLLINEGKVVALLDWEQMAYGDWMRDFSRFSFWEKNNYGDALDFANKFNLESENIQERTVVYWAINALRNIEFADRYKNKRVANWMRLHGESKLIG